MNKIGPSLDVAIIGAGPAGLSAAMTLQRAGLKVKVFERECLAGGVPRHCGHPAFGLREFQRLLTGPQYAQRMVRLAEEQGIEIARQHTITALHPNGLMQINSAQGMEQVTAQRVLISTGIRETPRSARLCSGDRPWGVMNTGALQSFIYLQKKIPFKRPLIVGTELVSMSAIWTCRLAGIKPAAVVEAGRRPVVQRPLALFPHLLGIPVYYHSQIVQIHGEQGRVSAVTINSANGLKTIACDGVVFTGQFVPESSLIRESHLLLDSGSQGPSIDQMGRCSDPTYFAAGNVLRSLETAGWSYREGRKMGELMIADLQHAQPIIDKVVHIEHAAPIKLVIPQRLSLPIVDPSLTHLQIRVTQAVNGLLTVRSAHKTLWQTSVNALPERRILISLQSLNLNDELASSATLWIGFQ